jgi:hypothetical protein
MKMTPVEFIDNMATRLLPEAVYVRQTPVLLEFFTYLCYKFRDIADNNEHHYDTSVIWTPDQLYNQDTMDWMIQATHTTELLELWVSEWYDINYTLA